MTNQFCIPSNVNFETAHDVQKILLSEVAKVEKKSACSIEFDAPDPSVLAIQLAASCISTLKKMGCDYQLNGQAADILSPEKAVTP
ncbi:MAG: hypothetical protein AB8B60_13325 [Sulfitobacter sp.]